MIFSEKPVATFPDHALPGGIGTKQCRKTARSGGHLYIFVRRP
jgi:hypothetical protein